MRFEAFFDVSNSEIPLTLPFGYNKIFYIAIRTRNGVLRLILTSECFMLRTFRRGTHPPQSKYTKDMPLAEFDAPQILAISLAQHIGAPSKPVVKEGDSVKVGTKIGEANGFVSANVFSSVSGIVKGFKKLPNAVGAKVMHVEIENDFKYDSVSLSPITDPTKENILERIREAGIVGMGGAAFPTHVKLSPNKPVDTLIINGAECEPYITCDYRLMLEKSKEILKGVNYLKTVLGVEKAYIGIENNKKDAIELLKSIAPNDIEIVALKAKYPQGAEKQLIYSITKRIVPTGALPMDVGVVVANVHTAYSVCRAVDNGEPCYMRAMTLSGDGIEKKGNYFVRNGISFEFLYEKVLGSVSPDVTRKVVSGGPMMGFSESNLLPTTTKGTSSLLFLSEKQVNVSKPTQCINCGSCVRGCPMSLNPSKIEAMVLNAHTEKLKEMNPLSCIECGVCAYSCPAKRPLLSAVRLAKKIIKEGGEK